MCSYVALMPPTNVYKATPTGRRKVDAMMCIPVLTAISLSFHADRSGSSHMAVITAEAPSNMFATAMMLFTRQRNIYTICATLPGPAYKKTNPKR